MRGWRSARADRLDRSSGIIVGMGDIKPLPSRTWRIIVITTLAAALGVAIVTVCESMLLVEWIPAAMTRLFVGVPCVLVWLGATAYAFYSYRGVWPYVVTPVVFFVGIAALLAVNAPQRVQFRLSEDALTEAARRCEPASDLWIGAYPVDSVEPVDGACLIYLPGGFIDRIGLVLLPDGPPADSMERWNITTSPYRGDWYRFVWHF